MLAFWTTSNANKLETLKNLLSFDVKFTFVMVLWILADVMNFSYFLIFSTLGKHKNLNIANFVSYGKTRLDLLSLKFDLWMYKLATNYSQCYFSFMLSNRSVMYIKNWFKTWIKNQHIVAHCPSKTCAGEGFVGKDCKCWCKGTADPQNQPVVECDGGEITGTRPPVTPSPVTPAPVTPSPGNLFKYL